MWPFVHAAMGSIPPYYEGYWAEFDVNGNMVPNSRPYDSGNHGTHVSGTVAGRNVTHQIGVAPEVTLVHALVLSGDSGSLPQVLAGMEWVAEGGFDVINGSLGPNRIVPDMAIATDQLARGGGRGPALVRLSRLERGRGQRAFVRLHRRPRKERPRNERPRNERPRNEPPRNERPRNERPRNEPPRNERHETSHGWEDIPTKTTSFGWGRVNALRAMYHADAPGTEKVPVSGRVTGDGLPVAGAKVSFHGVLSEEFVTDGDGNGAETDGILVAVFAPLPRALSFLVGNNPFNPTLEFQRFDYTVPAKGRIQVAVYTLDGPPTAHLGERGESPLRPHGVLGRHRRPRPRCRHRHVRAAGAIRG